MRLVDQVIVAAGSGFDDPLTALAADVVRVECFELTPEVRDACFEVARSKPSSILAALSRARLPYAKTWIEWNGWPLEPGTERWRYACFVNAPDGLDNGYLTLLQSLPDGRAFDPDASRERAAAVHAAWFEETRIRAVADYLEELLAERQAPAAPTGFAP